MGSAHVSQDIKRKLIFLWKTVYYNWHKEYRFKKEHERKYLLELFGVIKANLSMGSTHVSQDVKHKLIFCEKTVYCNWHKEILTFKSFKSHVRL